MFGRLAARNLRWPVAAIATGGSTGFLAFSAYEKPPTDIHKSLFGPGELRENRVLAEKHRVGITSWPIKGGRERRHAQGSSSFLHSTFWYKVTAMYGSWK